MNVSRLACVSTVFLTFLPLALPARAASSVALVLDASGSMNAKLPEGKTRIEAAKLAVTDLVGKLPTDVRLSLWAYGHQSPTSKHDCRDAQRVVEFAAISANKARCADQDSAPSKRRVTHRLPMSSSSSPTISARKMQSRALLFWSVTARRPVRETLAPPRRR